jgi:hypothetical protein
LLKTEACHGKYGEEKSDRELITFFKMAHDDIDGETILIQHDFMGITVEADFAICYKISVKIIEYLFTDVS